MGIALSTSTDFIKSKGSVVTKHYAGGAFRVGGVLYYNYADHLGSTSITLDASNVKTETRYKAWGEVRYQSGSMATDRTYTGQRSYTSDFGLMFYNARWYDASIGRFAQADNIEIKTGDTQSLERYAYAQNNPVKYNDPTGHCVGPLLAVCLVFGFIVGVVAISSAIDTIEVNSMEANSAMQQPGFHAEQAELHKWQDNCMGQCHYASALNSVGSTGPRPETPLTNKYSNAMAGVGQGTIQLIGGIAGLSSLASIPSTFKAQTTNESFASQMEPSEAARYNQYWEKSAQQHAPVRSSPYDIYYRYNMDGDLHQVTTYDEYGRRIYQYDLEDFREGEHYHTFDSYSSQYPNGIGSV